MSSVFGATKPPNCLEALTNIEHSLSPSKWENAMKSMGFGKEPPLHGRGLNMPWGFLEVQAKGDAIVVEITHKDPTLDRHPDPGPIRERLDRLIEKEQALVHFRQHGPDPNAVDYDQWANEPDWTLLVFPKDRKTIEFLRKVLSEN